MPKSKKPSNKIFGIDRMMTVSVGVALIIGFFFGAYSRPDENTSVDWEEYVEYVTAPWKTYSNNDYLFSIKYPDYLKANEVDEPNYLFNIYFDPTEEMSFSQVKIKECNSLNEAVDFRKKEIKKNEYFIFYKEQNALIDNISGYLMRYEYGGGLGGDEYIVKKNNYCYFVLSQPVANSALSISTFKFID